MKQVLAIGAIGFLGYQGYRWFRELKIAREGFQISLHRFEFPQIKTAIAMAPIEIRVFNPSQLSVTINNLRVNLSVWQRDKWVKAGELEEIPPFTVIPGATLVPAQATIWLKEFIPYKGLDFSAILSSLMNQGDVFNLQYQVTATINRLPFTYTDTLSLNLPDITDAIF